MCHTHSQLRSYSEQIYRFLLTSLKQCYLKMRWASISHRILPKCKVSTWVCCVLPEILVISSNIGTILHHFWYIATYENANFTYFILGVNPFEFLDVHCKKALGYPSLTTSWSYLASFWQNARLWRTANRWTDISTMANTRRQVTLTPCKNLLACRSYERRQSETFLCESRNSAGQRCITLSTLLNIKKKTLR